jgi:hypothetical protein
MKKIILCTLLITILPLISHGAGYVLGNFGTGGKVHDPSYGLEMGGIFLSPYHPNGGAFSLGLGASIAQTDENPPSDPIKKYNDGTEQEIYTTFGAEIVPAFFGVAGVGYASQEIVKPGLSGKESDTQTNVAWILGMRYVVRGFNMGVGFDTRRGVTASLGVAF